MNFTHLIYFQKAVQYGSIHKAARELFITPSGLSMALNNLEKELGYLLFVRSKKGLSLTPEGEDFASDVDIILGMQNKWSEVGKRIRMPDKIALKIAVIPAVYNSILGPFVAENATLENPIHIVAHEHTCAEINQALMNRQMRYAITSFNKGDDKSLAIMADNLGLDFVFLAEDSYSVYVGKASPLYHETMCHAKDLVNWTGASMGHDSINQFDSQRFFDQKHLLFFHNQSFLLQKVATSTCFAILPSLLRHNPLCKSGALHRLTFSEAVTPVCYALIRPTKDNITAQENTFMQALIDYFSCAMDDELEEEGLFKCLS